MTEQPISTRLWFRNGYLDATEGRAQGLHGCAAYNFGFEAARRDLATGTVGEARAWRDNVAYGNVAEEG